MNSTARGVIAAIIGVLLVGNGLALKFIDPNEIHYPKVWDARVAPLARFVEDTRHLSYEHPVEVRFLTPEEYKKEVLGDDEEQNLSEDDKKEIARFEGQFRALGLIGDKTSIFDDLNQIQSEGTDAFYSPETKQIVVYGTTLDVQTKVVLVHELTHVLQDQHFDLSRSFDSDGADSMFKALTEGDAVRIENEYVDQLSDDDQDAYYDAVDADDGSDDRSLDNVAPALLQMFGAPYALGEPMATIVSKVQGQKALDALFENPIASDEGLIDIFSLLDGDRPKVVAPPKLGDNEHLTDEASDFGAVTWYLVLASFVDPKVALKAVDGWGGDSYVGFRKGDTECIKAAFVGDTPNDTNEMHAALDQWKQAFPVDKVSVTGDESRLELSACEPGTVPKPRDDVDQALSLPALRMQILSEVLAAGMKRELAECYVPRVVDQLPLDVLNSDDDKDVATAQRVSTEVGRQCIQELGSAAT